MKSAHHSVLFGVTTDAALGLLLSTVYLVCHAYIVVK